MLHCSYDNVSQHSQLTMDATIHYVLHCSSDNVSQHSQLTMGATIHYLCA